MGEIRSLDGEFKEILIEHNDGTVDEPSELLQKIGVDSIAQYLLQNKLILTALEYHMELLESGRELSRLQNFFSDPGNFEQQGSRSFSVSNTLYRTGSFSTFDSLDFTRSEDGALVNDRVAVLEFELRQANKTIENLRMSLTGSLDDESLLKLESMRYKQSGPQYKGRENYQSENDCNPLIKRAINYLINEYLLQNGYKLSSITLAEEISDQDFEDWDDVGLAMPKPPNLLKLFQEHSAQNKHHHLKTQDAAVNTDGNLSTVETLLKSREIELERIRREIAMLKHRSENIKDEIKSTHSSTVLTGDLHCYIPNHSSFCRPELHFGTLSCVADRPVCKTVLPFFWNKLRSFLEYQSCSDGWLFEEVSVIASDADHFVLFLTKYLPDIIRSVDSEKCNKIVPLLVSVAIMQSDSAKRYALLHDLFNFIEKPEKKQRQIILSGCVAYSKAVGAIRTEEDLLPQFSEQIGHKFPERRQLVAEACGAIAPLLRPEMRSSLVFSILRQMEQEESEEKVRIAIIRSFAVLVSVLENDDKYSQSFHVVCAFVNDHNYNVQEAAREYLLPAFACWSRQTGKFISHLLDHFLQDLEHSIGSQDDMKNSFKFDKLKFLLSLESLHCLLSSLFSEMLLTMPVSDDIDDDGSSLNILPLIEFEDVAYKINFYLDSEEQFLRLFKKFSCGSCNFDVKDWKSLRHFFHGVMPRLVKVVQNVMPDNEDCVVALCEFFSSLATLFGVEFVRNCLSKQYFDMQFKEKSKDPIKRTPLRHIFLTSAVAVYSCGILGTIHLVVGTDELSSFLTDTIISLSMTDAPLESVRIALVMLRKKGKSFYDVVLNVLKSCVTHPSKSVRVAAGNLYEVMAVPEVCTEVRESIVLPALLTLAKDEEDNVKIATLRPLGALIECSNHGDSVIDAVIAQFAAFIAPADMTAPVHAMNLGIVKIIGQVTPKADPKFCKDFALPHLAAIAAKK